MAKIIFANAEYTGGNIYRYTAKLDNGNFMVGNSEWDCIYIVDSDPNATEDSWYGEWFDTHTVSILEDKDYYKNIVKLLRWILDNKPDGNYSDHEIDWLLNEELDAIEESKMGKTEKTLAKIPGFAHDRVMKLKKEYSKTGDKGLVKGYLLGLKDMDIIDESERKALYIYITL